MKRRVKSTKKDVEIDDEVREVMSGMQVVQWKLDRESCEAPKVTIIDEDTREDIDTSEVFEGDVVGVDINGSFFTSIDEGLLS